MCKGMRFRLSVGGCGGSCLNGCLNGRYVGSFSGSVAESSAREHTGGFGRGEGWAWKLCPNRSLGGFTSWCLRIRPAGNLDW